MSAVAGVDEAREFARSVGGVLDRALPRGGAAPDWTPGATPDAGAASGAALSATLDELGWSALARDPELVRCAGLGGVELGRRQAPVWQVDRLLGAAPMAGDLVRAFSGYDHDHARVLRRVDGTVETCAVARATACAAAAGLDVRRVIVADGPGEPVDADAFAVAQRAWLAASIGYLAGVGACALELTVDYTRQRRAFGSTLAALAPVQQRLATAATAVRGVTLLAAEAPDVDALAHAGEAVVAACAECQQVSGAIGYTLEYPLHRCTQLARGIQSFNDALVDDASGVLAPAIPAG